MSEPQDENRQSGKEELRPEIRALVPYYEYPDEGMDLVDIGVTLWKRWKLMLVIFLICLAAGLLWAFLFRVYAYTTVIKIGSVVVGTQTQPIETPGSAVFKLQRGFLTQAILSRAKTHNLDPQKFTFDVEAPPQTDLVIISATGKLPRAEDYLAMERASADLLIASEVPMINIKKAGLKAQLTQAKSKLEQLKDPQNLRLLKSQIASLTAYQDEARSQQLASSHQTADPSGAMTQLLLGSQVQRASDQLFTLNQQLNNLPSDIGSQQAEVTNLETQLDNIQATRISVGPMRSIEPVGLSPIIIGIIGAIIGIILALIGAACANYVSAVRRRVGAGAG